MVAFQIGMGDSRDKSCCKEPGKSWKTKKKLDDYALIYRFHYALAHNRPDIKR